MVSWIWPATSRRRLVSDLMTVEIEVVTLAMVLTVNAPVLTLVLVVKYGTRNDSGRCGET